MDDDMRAIAPSGAGPGDERAFRGDPLEAEDFESFRAALGEAGLPADDLHEVNVSSFRFSHGGKTVGYGAMEPFGTIALLRSIVVVPDARGEGVGRAIVDWLLARAGRCGAERAFLFTIGARAWFEGLGFEAQERALAPSSILATRQATALCPASAALMVRPTSR